MASQDPDSLAESLLAWVRSFEHVGKVDQLSDLGDARALWAILQDVDPDYFSGSLPEPDIDASTEWTRKWQNLKHLEKQLSIYYRDVCSGPVPTAAANGPDLKAIAEENSLPALERLIMEIIRAAMASPESNQRMGKRLLGLGNEHAMAIAYEIRSMQEVEVPGSEIVSHDDSASQSDQDLAEPIEQVEIKQDGHGFGDPLLEREEELLKAQATIEKLQRSHTDAQRQLQLLRQDKEQLQEAFDAYRTDINNRGRKVGGGDEVKKLQRQADNDRAYIDDLEAQLQSSRNAVENYERQIQRFKEEHEATQKLRDDLQVLRAENEDLNQKVKANENLKKKIQALQEQDKANASLKEELKVANEKLDDLDRLKKLQASLEKEIIEKKGLIRNQEYQITELTTTRKHAEYDAKVLAQKLEAARERQERDHEAIEELRAKLQDSGTDEDTDLDAPELKKSTVDGDGDDSDGEEKKRATQKDDESKHLAEKIVLLEQQLEAADQRLKQISQRNAALEEHSHGREDADEEGQKKAQEQLAERESTIADLQTQLDRLQKQTPKEPPPPPDVVALQRENRLMATAWYDLSSRLHNNGMSLGRRRQEPKSWIGKQRSLVGPSSNISTR
jgi:protein HOOK3